MSTSQKNKTATFIKWVDVQESLPTSGTAVLALTKTQMVLQTTFDANVGWKFVPYKNSGEVDGIVFWSYFNLPK